MSIDKIAIRRAIIQTTIGSEAFISTPPGTEDEAESCALEFSKAKKIPLIISIVQGGLEITRTMGSTKPSIYPEMDGLKVGEHHVFPFPPAMHSRVRVAASFRNQSGVVRFSCTRDGEQIRVTRLPMNDEEAKGIAPIKIPGRASRWQLDRLATEPQLKFEVNRAEQHKLRLAVSNKARITNWIIRCQVQSDGTMLVYRADPGAPRPAPATTTPE